MSQRILKCTVCGGDHSIFHCENRCGVCHGDSRQCSCNERPPQKRKKTSKSTASSQQPADTSHDDLKKKYESLQKDYKRVGQAFQNLKEQNQELTALLEEREKEAEPRPRSDIGARSGGCLSQKTSALHPSHEQHEERGAAVANEVRGTFLRVKYLVYFTTHKTAPLGATKSMKVNDQQ